MSLISFIQEKTIHGFGEYSDSQVVEHPSWRILGKNESYRALEEAPGKQGMII